MYVLGIDLGTTFTAAAVWRDGRAEICALGTRAAAVPSVVLMRADHTVLTGEAANRRALIEPDRVAREFKRRFGDSTPVLLGGSPYTADVLTATLLASVVADVTTREGAEPTAICVSHPANWGSFKTELLRQAVRSADLDLPTRYTTEPEAAAISYSQEQRLAVGETIAVYDLGGGTFDAAVLRRTPDGFTILGQPEGIERLGGIDIDAAVFHHVVQALGDGFTSLDEDDPAAITAVARLRQDCTDAKEALSSDTDVSIPVILPGITTEVRLTRAELESMVRPALYDSIEATKRALRSAGTGPDELTAVLLVGGSSRMPLVAQLVGAELGRPVAIDVHPKHAVALGAAWLASGETLAADPAPAPVAAAVHPSRSAQPGAAAAADMRPAPPTRVTAVPSVPDTAVVVPDTAVVVPDTAVVVPDTAVVVSSPVAATGSQPAPAPSAEAKTDLVVASAAIPAPAVTAPPAAVPAGAGPAGGSPPAPPTHFPMARTAHPQQALPAVVSAPQPFARSAANQAARPVGAPEGGPDPSAAGPGVNRLLVAGLGVLLLAAFTAVAGWAYLRSDGTTAVSLTAPAVTPGGGGGSPTTSSAAPATVVGVSSAPAAPPPAAPATSTATGSATGTVLVSLRGAGTVSGAVTCHSTCSLRWATGRIVHLHAEPAAGFAFAGWNGCTGTSNRDCTLVVAAQSEVSLAFLPAASSTPSSSASLSASPGASGSSSSSPSASASPSTQLPGAVASMSLSGATPTTLVVDWGPASLATRYRLHWSESPGGRTWTSSGQNYGGGPVTLINLVSGETYTVSVTPYNDAGDGPTTTKTATLP